MTFEPIRDDRGQPRARCICDDCLREEVIAAVHGQDGQGQAVVKIQRLGWSVIGKRLRCPTCEARRKVGKMSDRKVKGAAVAIPPKVPSPMKVASPMKVPSKAQKREIIDLLGEVYDAEHECYRRGDTDDTVADVLGVMPGWVAGLREEFFGAAGSNEDMTALAAELSGFITSARAAQAACEQQAAALLAEIGRAEGFRQRLAGIERAVGPRVLARAT